jgi:hypothetical protein
VTVTERLIGATVPLLLSAATASVISLAAWHLLPYEALERGTPEAQFLLWESIMWMIGLALAFFGLAALLGSTDLAVQHGDPHRERSAQHIRIQVQQGVRGRMLFSDLPSVPWFMMGVGMSTLVFAFAMRFLAGY